MSLIIPPGYLQAVYRHLMTNDAEIMVTTCGHEIADAADPEDYANRLHLAWAEHVVPATMSTNMTFVGVDVYVGQDGGPPVVGTSTEAPVTGNQGAGTAPPNTATLVRKRTDLAGRRGRGRFYLPGVPLAALNVGGTLAPAHIEVVNDAMTEWRADLVAGLPDPQLPPVVLHRSEGIGAEPPPTPIVTLICESKVATQRQRLRP